MWKARVGAWRRDVRKLKLRLRGVPPLGRDPERFPSPAPPSRQRGVVAFGGDLSPSRLLAAYRRGIFPWFTARDPILWHSPDPRFVLELSRFRVPTTLRKVARSGTFEIRYDTGFERVVTAAAQVARSAAQVTWLTDEVIAAYVELHRLGYAHSAEAWREGELVGGLYGLAIGDVWFGESMFTRASNAGNAAFIVFTQQLKEWGFKLVDCQTRSEHLARFGAEPWPRERFLAAIAGPVRAPSRLGPWSQQGPLRTVS